MNTRSGAGDRSAARTGVAWYSGELAGIVGRRLVERNAAYEKSRVVQLLARERLPPATGGAMAEPENTQSTEA